LDYSALAQKYGTPLYIYDFDHMTRQYHTLKEAFGARKSLLAYAIKANSNLSVIAHFARLGAGADCVSLGEIKRAQLAGVPKYKIIFSGMGKRDDEIAGALEADILFINVESEAELGRVEAIAQQMGLCARVSVRVNPDIDPQTHPYISTGLMENKFGVSIDTARGLYLRIKNSPHLEATGIHFHIGSQLTELDPILEATDRVADLLRSLKALELENLRFFDVGGGLGITYKEESPIDAKAYAEGIYQRIKDLDMTILCEPGRFLTGAAGHFLTRVLYEKYSGQKRFVVVDGAMNDLLRPTLYQAYHRIELAGKSGEGVPADVVGPVCESGDYFAKGVPLPKSDHDDLMVIHSAGAYGFVMSSNYNSRRRAAEVALEGGVDRLIRPRERYEDLWQSELELMEAR
jgi:diaminopimelate decarboxylase